MYSETDTYADDDYLDFVYHLQEFQSFQYNWNFDWNTNKFKQDEVHQNWCTFCDPHCHAAKKRNREINPLG